VSTVSRFVTVLTGIVDETEVETYRCLVGAIGGDAPLVFALCEIADAIRSQTEVLRTLAEK
jgi:hypothetical protein